MTLQVVTRCNQKGVVFLRPVSTLFSYIDPFLFSEFVAIPAGSTVTF